MLPRLPYACRTFTGWLVALLPLASVFGQDDKVRRPPDDQVSELTRYLEQIEIYAPSVHRHLGIFPVRLRSGSELRGAWLTMDQALARGDLRISEKGERGSVPNVVIENRSREAYVFILAGELLAGGRQTRTVRQDLVLAPGQCVDVPVFCVEAHRWAGDAQFQSTPAMAPSSLQQELRRGAEQSRIWAEVARNNAALGAENSTGSLERALQADLVRARLMDVRSQLLPQLPNDMVGLLVVDRQRAVGAEFFGNAALAAALLPKVLDAYAVDLILKRGDFLGAPVATQQEAAIALFRSLQQARHQRAPTPGSGAGIRTRSGGLLGDGVSLGDAVVHYGVQIQERIVPLPR